MYISDLKLVDYRNYKEEKIKFSKGINIFVGDNAQGKTNLLEAVYYCSRGSSFKSVKDRDIIKSGAKKSELHAQIIKENRRKIISIEIDDKKKIQINDFEINSLKDMKQQFDIVYFWPDHLRVVKDGPSLRRELVDEALITIKPHFKGLLDKFTKLLIQRNSLIKTSSKAKYFKEELNTLSRQLAEEGSKIMVLRKKYVDLLDERARQINFNLSDGKEKIKLTYSHCLADIEILGLKREDVKEELYKNIMANVDKDLKYGFTSMGPHRDDLEIEVNGQNAKIFCSQGQQRSIILSIKIAEMNIVKEFNGSMPILLLDDVFSELDMKRKKRFLDNLNNCQALITTNDVSFFNIHKLENKIKIVEIERGKIK